jgi:hypothetical protein
VSFLVVVKDSHTIVDNVEEMDYMVNLGPYIYNIFQQKRYKRVRNKIYPTKKKTKTINNKIITIKTNSPLGNSLRKLTML